MHKEGKWCEQGTWRVTALGKVLLAVALGSLLAGGFSLAAGEPELLAVFLPDATVEARLRPVVEKLESESFVERQAASRELAALPALPPFIRELAAHETRAESRARLRALTAAFPIDTENARLTRLLERIASEAIKGQLPALVRVIGAGAWQPEEQAVDAAARATVTPADADTLATLSKDDSPTLRRIAVAALSGLKSEESSAGLLGFLDDPDPRVGILAAEELGTRGEVKALAALARLLGATDLEIRHRAHAALRGFSGQDFRFDPWAEPPARREAMAQWQRWATSGDAAITGKAPENTSIVLFNGRDLEGWEVRLGNEIQDKTDAWEAVAGELHCVGRVMVKTGDLWSRGRFENYVLRLEYRAEEAGSDSGVGVLLTQEGEQQAIPQYLEVQLLPDNGGDLYQIGNVNAKVNGKPIQFQSPRTKTVKDTAGKWHQLKLTVRNGTVQVEINGTVVNRTSDGPRGPGRIVLRNEGSGVQFRNIELLPVPGVGPAEKP